MDGARWSFHKIRTNNTTHNRSPWQNRIYVSWMKRHICLYLFHREYKLFSYRFSVCHNLRQWGRFNLKTRGFLKAISDTRDHGATHLGPICLCICFICHGERISMPLVSFRCHMYSVWWYYPWSVRHMITVSHVCALLKNGYKIWQLLCHVMHPMTSCQCHIFQYMLKMVT